MCACISLCFKWQLYNVRQNNEVEKLESDLMKSQEFPQHRISLDSNVSIGRAEVGMVEPVWTRFSWPQSVEIAWWTNTLLLSHTHSHLCAALMSWIGIFSGETRNCSSPAESGGWGGNSCNQRNNCLHNREQGYIYMLPLSSLSSKCCRSTLDPIYCWLGIHVGRSAVRALYF